MQRQKEQEDGKVIGEQNTPALHEYEIRERYYRPSFLPAGGNQIPPGAAAYWQYPAAAFNVELRPPFEVAASNFYQPNQPHEVRTIPPNLPKPFRADFSRPTRPQEQPHAASIPTWRPVEPQPQIHSHFQLGSLIQLANGDLKRVENLSTEDFLRSAKSSTDVKIDHSVVTSLDLHADRGVASIAFSVGHEKVQVNNIEINLSL